jgi:type IX secretion system PorP/SprF family membrane protein
MKKIIPYFIGLFCSAFSLSGQDMHFSQFNENPSLLNPALAGSDGIRASLNYRTQWRSVSTPYRTYGASFEMRLPPFKKKNARAASGATRPGKFGVGLSVYRDKMGDAALMLTQANLSIAYFAPTGEHSAFSLGAITSFNQRRLNDTKFIFPNQYDGLGYNIDMNSNEALINQRFSYLDFAAGLLWTYNSEERRIKDHKFVKVRLGASAYHLTQPGQKYRVKSAIGLPMKIVAHGDFHFSIQNTNVAIAPAYLFQLQGPYMDIVAGTLVKYYTKNDTKYTGYVKRTSYGLGAFYRNADALIIQGLLEWTEQYAIGISYDINMSPLAKASALRGGLEISLRYGTGNPFLYQKLR